MIPRCLLVPIVRYSVSCWHIWGPGLLFPSCDPHSLYAKHPRGPITSAPQGFGKPTLNTLMYLLLAVLRVIASFVSHPGVSCLLPASMT